MSVVLNFPDTHRRRELRLEAHYLTQKRQLEDLNLALDGLYRALTECKGLGQRSEAHSDR